MDVQTSLILIVCVLVAVVLSVAIRGSSKRRGPQLRREHRAADGEVEWQAVPGVVSEPNPAHATYSRFVRLSGRSAERVPVHSHSRQAPPLVGEVVLWSIFIGRDGTEWSDHEVALTADALHRSALWIEDQATRWQAPTNIRLASVYFLGQDDHDEAVEVGFQYNGEEVGPSEGDAEIKGIASASRVASALGFRDLVDLIETMTPKVEADVQAWLIHLRRRGQSFAVSPDLTPIPGLSLAFCYLREESFSEPLGLRTYATDPVTLTHELLHLFGASDKYGLPLSHFPENSVTSRDVMRLSHTRLWQLSVDRLTATEIGWA